MTEEDAARLDAGGAHQEVLLGGEALTLGVRVSFPSTPDPHHVCMRRPTFCLSRP